MRTDAVTVDRWRERLHRAALVTVVIAWHFGLWLMLAGPRLWFWDKPRIEIRRQGDVLEVRFVRSPPRSADAARPPASADAPMHRMPTPHSAVTRARPTARPLPVAALPSEPAMAISSANAIALSPPAGADHIAGGGFQSTLQSAQRAASARRPGALTSHVPGIQLDPRSSIKNAAGGFTKAVYCSSMQLSMQRARNPLTPQLMDRLLQLEGCGPHIEATAHDAVEAEVVREATFGH